MRVFKKIAAMQACIAQITMQGNSIGFVPTMGALHQGHISLLINSKQENAVTICSIFINPAQFNDAKDFEKYPVTIEKDIELLEKNGCDILFIPAVQEIYPDGFANPPHYALGFLETILEGQYRPGHFQGVCRVVERLLKIVMPHNLYLGQKDYQQCMVIKKLVALTHLNINIIICPTLREPDGLAMSSRNMRLTAEEKKQAAKISETLFFIKKEIKAGYVADLEQRAIQYLTAENFKVDYVSIAAAATLQPVQNWDGKRPLVVLAAAYLNTVRLIDNLLI